jgi:hypothetical protein
LTTPIKVVFSRPWDKFSSFIVSSRERQARGFETPRPPLIAEMVTGVRRHVNATGQDLTPGRQPALTSLKD